MVGRFVDIRGIVYHHCVKLSFLIFLNSIIHVVKIMIVSNRASNITNDMQMYLLRRIPVRGDSQHNTIYVDMHRKKAHGFGKDVKLMFLARMLSTRLLRPDMLLFLLELSLLKHDILIFRYHRHLFHIYICLLSTSTPKERSLSVLRRLPQFTVEKTVLEFLK